MSFSDNPEKYFDNVETVYKFLNKSKWMGNEYKIMPVITIWDHADEGGYKSFVDRTNKIYLRMKGEHKWLTSG